MQLDNPKLLTLEQALEWREQLSARGLKLVMTNGCFDLLHTGHLFFLKQAKDNGDRLLIALNGDVSVQMLKGPTRPVQSEQERAYLLAELTCVDALLVFNTPRLATEIQALRPDVYVKAGDYNPASLNPLERTALEAVAAEIQFLPFLPGYSTTHLIEKIANAAHAF